MADNNKLLFALSLCKKAGKIVVGSDMTAEAIRKGKSVFLVLLASDASENTKKKISDKSSFYGKKLIYVGIDGYTLAKAIGKDGSVSALAIIDGNLAKLVEESI